MDRPLKTTDELIALLNGRYASDKNGPLPHVAIQSLSDYASPNWRAWLEPEVHGEAKRSWIYAYA